jgi:acetyl esterase/lipase
MASFSLFVYLTFLILQIFVVFAPVKKIRHGWLWFFQIFVTEWSLGIVLVNLVFAMNLLSDFSLSWIELIFASALTLSTMVSLIEIFQFSFTINGQTQKQRINWFKTLAIPFIGEKPSVFKVSFDSKDSLMAPSEVPDALIWGSAQSPKLIVMIHGGAWLHGDASQLQVIPKDLLKQGYSIISLNYRKLPKHRWPVPFEDVCFYLQEILKLRPTGSQTWLMGRSAGGHLALLAAAKFPAQVAGVIALYPVCDMLSFYDQGEENDLLQTRPLLRKFLNGKPDQQKSIYEQASPSQNFFEKFPPVLLAHGERDPLVSAQQSALLKSLSDRLKNKLTYLHFPKASHGFDGAWNGPSSQVFRKTILDFLVDQKSADL